ncbi:transcription initiation factor TFIID subunit 5 [Platysternon megacephalum]|uniref:Transcription initiation factor TFIID subunit 5 n=1 Tax=Platysternon megacephalum TaxID=55544 RepID=A0A4D9E9J1_9SAUR|nr:transcription initiation factor TFIID subunit 5 [Platysternon megacephalum]
MWRREQKRRGHHPGPTYPEEPSRTRDHPNPGRRWGLCIHLPEERLLPLGSRNREHSTWYGTVPPLAGLAAGTRRGRQQRGRDRDSSAEGAMPIRAPARSGSWSSGGSTRAERNSAPFSGAAAGRLRPLPRPPSPSADA